MGTFKSNLFGVCKEVAAEFEGWSFMDGRFKNKSLKGVELVIGTGFGFKHGDSTPLRPAILVYDKKIKMLSESLLGRESATSGITFKELFEDLGPVLRGLGASCWIEADKKRFLELAPSAKEREHRFVDIAEIRPILRAVVQDGIRLLEKYYDLRSEERLLRNLPPKYTPYNQIIYDVMERNSGVVMCLVRILLGDFDFVEHYRSDDYKTIFPKNMADLDKIVAALPDLRLRYAETGSVI